MKILEKNRGREVSGEYIASRFGVSRALVCKAVKKLRAEGNDISARNNGGYTLSENSDALSAIGIRERMNKIRQVVYLPETDSTNRQAKLMALDGAEDGTIVVTDCQTAGRGRRGRSFFSPAGSGVYFSVIIRPDIDYMQCQKIVPMTAVAVTRAIESVCGLITGIKWVNDIYYNGKKVVGIATETIGELGGLKPDALIVGIGINVNTDNFPPELKDKAGSLGADINRNLLVAACVDAFFDLYGQLEHGAFMDEYRKKCFIINKKVEVLGGTRSFYAKATDIDDFGALIVETEEGEVKKLFTEEVSIRLDAGQRYTQN